AAPPEILRDEVDPLCPRLGVRPGHRGLRRLLRLAVPAGVRRVGDEPRGPLGRRPLRAGGRRRPQGRPSDLRRRRRLALPPHPPPPRGPLHPLRRRRSPPAFRPVPRRPPALTGPPPT